MGNWTVTLSFPGDYLSLPASITRTVIVQQTAVPIGYPDTPLPTTGPLTFPINVENRQWITIAGPWYMSYYNASQGACNPFTTAPTTAHVLWDIPAYAGLGGFVGDQGDIQTGGGNFCVRCTNSFRNLFPVASTALTLSWLDEDIPILAAT